MPQLVVTREEKPHCSSAQLSMGQFDVNGDIPVKELFPGTYWCWKLLHLTLCQGICAQGTEQLLTENAVELEAAGGDLLFRKCIFGHRPVSRSGCPRKAVRCQPLHGFDTEQWRLW